jgi:hypothetical protein
VCGFVLLLPVSDHVREEPTLCPDDVFDELKGFGHRSDHGQTVVADDVK